MSSAALRDEYTLLETDSKPELKSTRAHKLRELGRSMRASRSTAKKARGRFLRKFLVALVLLPLSVVLAVVILVGLIALQADLSALLRIPVALFKQGMGDVSEAATAQGELKEAQRRLRVDQAEVADYDGSTGLMIVEDASEEGSLSFTDEGGLSMTRPDANQSVSIAANQGLA